MMDLDSVRAFVTFAEHLNLTHAARELHLSQPALHARLKKLGDELGVTLYRRDGRRLVLTPAGEEVARFGREVVRRALDFEARLTGRAERQPVVLAAGEGAWLYVLGEAVRAFSASGVAPLRLWTMGGEEAVEAARWGRAHIGVTSVAAGREERSLVEEEGLVVRELTRVPQVLIVPKAHQLAAREALTPEALEGLALIVPPQGRAHREVLEETLGRARVSWEVAVEASGWPLMLRFVEMGVGLAVVNGCCPAPEGFVARPIPALPTRVYVAVRRAELRDEAVERLLGWMVEQASGG